MKLVVFTKRSSPGVGYRIGAFLSDDRIADLTPEFLTNGLSQTDILKCFDLERDFVSPAASAIQSGAVQLFEREEIRLEAPIQRPGKIVCVGLNYRDHAEESGMAIPTSPIIFSKFSTAVIGPDAAIELPEDSSEVDYEAELAVVIGRRAKSVSASDAMSYVFGYTNFNDVSARDMQFADGQWQRGKSCDTFAPMGEFIATPDEIVDPHDLRISFRLNGETLQDSSTGQMIFRIPELIEFISKTITLEPGDLIATGTPPGVGFARTPKVFLRDGDFAEVEIEGLGVLRNSVIQR
ncbi:MAG TPA: fumarylacetoacetate hydrolase family protein [Pyrinomonadaceae bacterium]|nr:fumarylacetoacetate hydrolase family protein [Pyrinomonadaceae bacterium]